MTVSKPNAVEESNNLFDLGNYPNPFTDATNIYFSLTKPEHIRLVIYNDMGKEITKVLDENKTGGEYSVSLDQYLNDRSCFPSGSYFYILTIGSKQLQRKMIRLR